MPVVINEMVSRVNVTEGSGGASEEMIDQIVRMVMARVLEQIREAEELRKIQEIPDQMANIRPY